MIKQKGIWILQCSYNTPNQKRKMLIFTAIHILTSKCN